MRFVHLIIIVSYSPPRLGRSAVAQTPEVNIFDTYVQDEAHYQGRPKERVEAHRGLHYWYMFIAKCSRNLPDVRTL